MDVCRIMEPMRIMEDNMIYIIWGHPGQGKSYFGTAMAVRAMQQKKKFFQITPFLMGKTQH